MAKIAGLSLEIDREKKTWVLRSKPMWSPETQERYYTDIEEIFHADPRKFTVEERRDSNGRFRSFSVTSP